MKQYLTSTKSPTICPPSYWSPCIYLLVLPILPFKYLSRSLPHHVHEHIANCRQVFPGRSSLWTPLISPFSESRNGYLCRGSTFLPCGLHNSVIFHVAPTQLERVRLQVTSPGSLGTDVWSLSLGNNNTDCFQFLELTLPPLTKPLCA